MSLHTTCMFILCVCVCVFSILQIDIYYEGWELMGFSTSDCFLWPLVSLFLSLTVCARECMMSQNWSVNAISVICLNSCIKFSGMYYHLGLTIQYNANAIEMGLCVLCSHSLIVINTSEYMYLLLYLAQIHLKIDSPRYLQSPWFLWFYYYSV